MLIFKQLNNFKRCLSDLKWFEEADECLKIFRKRFPDYANSQACDNLIKEINTGLENLKKAKRLSAQVKSISNKTINKLL